MEEKALWRRRVLAPFRSFHSAGLCGGGSGKPTTFIATFYCFEPCQQNSLHRHPVADEVVFCWEGEGIIVVGNKHAPFKAGETVLVPADTPHGYLNTSQDRRMIITVVQSPLPVEHVPVDPADLTTALNAEGVAQP